MKFLDAIVPPSSAPESRYSFSQWAADYFTFGGSRYNLGENTTYGNVKADPIANEFGGFVDGALKANGIISALELKRFSVFAEARFLFQGFRAGRPGDLFGTPDLSILERPWPGGTTGDLLTRMLLHADLAGNAYAVRVRDEIVLLRPDWVEILLTPRYAPDGSVLGMSKLGFYYWEGGKQYGSDPVLLAADEVAHFAPYPDPVASYRGMSWMTPVIREIQSDKQATDHKLRFFENAATPNLLVKVPQALTKQQLDDFIEAGERKYGGEFNAYKTMYLAGGADAAVLGANMQQMDFKAVQGAGETRLAAAAGVPAVIVGFSEGMQGSSLNAGNYSAAKRNFADSTMSPLWRNVAASLEVLVKPPSGARLWYDARDIAFLRDDVSDRADVQQKYAATIRQLVDAGYEPASVVAAVLAEDMSLLKHSGLMSVQLLPPGTTSGDKSEDDAPPARSEPLVAFHDGAFRIEPHTDVTIEDGAIQSRTEFPLDLSDEVRAHVDATKSDVESAAADVFEERAAELAEKAEAEAEALRARVEADLAAEREMLEQAKADLELERSRRREFRFETDSEGRVVAAVSAGVRKVFIRDERGHLAGMVEESE